MGIACQVYKNKEGDIDKIVAPNGEQSILYGKALALTGDSQKASGVWATAYTPGFLSYYGTWNNPSIESQYNLDANGEPMLEDVIAFMKKNTYKLEPFSSKDVVDVNNFMLSTGVSDARSLANKIRDNFIIDGNIIINDRNLRKSGLYNEVEINRILSDLSIKNSVVSSMRLLLDYSNNDNIGQEDDYYMSSIGYDGPIIFKSNSFNQFGKQDIYNPYEIDNDIKQKVGGIKDISTFSSLFNTLDKPELVDRFNNDGSFKNRVFEEYSNMDRIPVVNISNGTVSIENESLSKLTTYSFPNASKVKSMRKSISDVLRLSDKEWGDSNKVIKMLKDIESNAINFGIDVIGLSDIYNVKPQSEFDNVLMDLDIYIAGMHKYDYSGVRSLSNSINNLFGKESERHKVLTLPSHLQGRNVVYMEGNASPIDMYNNHSLLKVGENLYQRINKTGNKEELYSEIIETIKVIPEFISSEAYPSSFFKEGKLDYDKVKKVTDNNILLDSLKRFVLSNTDSNNSEEMVLNRLIFGQPLKTNTPSVDWQRSFNRYMSRESDVINSVIPINLYRKYLNNKLNNTDAYNDVLKYIDFKSNYTIGLNLVDDYTLKKIDLLSDGDIRKELFFYSMTSSDPTLKNLFYLRDINNIYMGEDVKHAIYKDNPSLLEEYSGTVMEIDENSIEANGVYDDFIRIGNNIYSKVSEGTNGSVYQNLYGTEADVKTESTQRQKKSIVENRGTAESPNINMLFTLSDNESQSLRRLEC
mgnify:FL=1